MIYIFDTSPLSTLFKNYYRRRFPSLWERFDGIVGEGRLVSTREVMREIEGGAVETLRDWADHNAHLFTAPSADEGVRLLPASTKSSTSNRTSSCRRF